MRYVFLQLVLFINIYTISAQEYTVYFENLSRTKNTISANTNPLFILDTDTLQIRDITYKIKLPNDIEITDAGFTRTYFAGRNDGIFNRFIWVLYLNYKSDTTIIIPDINCNLDFTDDNKRYYSSDYEPFCIMELTNSEDNSAIFRYKIQKATYRSQDSRKAIEDYHSRTDRNQGFITENIDYWINETRLNIHSCDTIIDNKKIQLALHDYDCNGFYNDIDSTSADNRTSDRFLVGYYGSDTISSHLYGGSTKISDDANIEIGNKLFKIIEVDKLGRYAKIQKTDIVSNLIKIGDTIPSMKVKMFDKQVMDLKNLLSSDRVNVINIWGIWCKPCLEKMPHLAEFYSKNSEKVNLINLHGNMDDEIYFEKIVKRSEELGVNWISGFLNNEIKSKLYIEQFPQLIIIGNDGRVMDFNISFSNLQKLIDSF